MIFNAEKRQIRAANRVRVFFDDRAGLGVDPAQFFRLDEIEKLGTEKHLQVAVLALWWGHPNDPAFHKFFFGAINGLGPLDKLGSGHQCCGNGTHDFTSTGRSFTMNSSYPSNRF